jgi:hypothetical protein
MEQQTHHFGKKRMHRIVCERRICGEARTVSPRRAVPVRYQDLFPSPYVSSSNDADTVVVSHKQRVGDIPVVGVVTKECGIRHNRGLRLPIRPELAFEYMPGCDVVVDPNKAAALLLIRLIDCITRRVEDVGIQRFSAQAG